MPPKRRRKNQPSWLVPLSVAAVAVVLVTLVITLSQGETDASSSESPQASGQDSSSERSGLRAVERRDDADPLADGPVDAPVALIVFSDYQCPYCAQWSNETLPLMKEHVTTGDLRIEWRDINVFGEPSTRAARAVYAAALQGAFWAYHEQLFTDGDTRSEAGLEEQALIDLAADLGLDVDRFATDFASDTTIREVDRNARIGLELGVNSTPAFILDGKPIMGAQPSNVFTDALDTALASRK
ncbi:MAG TPA: thioredoxin domain-containing protein [Candidatus Stackebrandtia excrementipullorum]|nr:thioredoxin domain-containing protein [Candidatus Stackebrandtia excrementipullorum]